MELAQSLRQVYNAVDPTLPLPSGDPRYVDCTSVRGNEDVVSRMFDAITWSEADTHQLFTGHRGCGKSTELLRLQARLEEAGYRVIYFAADEDLDLNDIVYSDLLLTIAKRIERGLAEQGIALDPDLLDNVLHWFREVVYTEEQWKTVQGEMVAEARVGVGLPESLPLIARLLSRVTGQIKTGRQVKEHIRRKLDPQISQSIDNVNLLLDEAYAKIARQGDRGLVVLIDNLDRITLTELESGGTSHEALYIDHGEQLRALNCHIVYTVPISMIYSPKATVLTGIFPDNCVLPMIKVHDRDGRDCDEGLERMREILTRRIDLRKVLTDEAVDHLCRASGGHPRHLMILVRYACTYAPRNVWPRPIDLGVTERAESRLVAEYSRMIPEEHFPLLARVYLNKTVENDPEHELMLYNLSVLEYYNGAPPWHDVHPVVRGLPKFQQALEHERAKCFGDE